MGRGEALGAGVGETTIEIRKDLAPPAHERGSQRLELWDGRERQGVGEAR